MTMTDVIPPDSKHPHFPHLFSPVKVGRFQLANRMMAPPHTSVIGNPYGSVEESERLHAYWDARSDPGVGWIDFNARLGNFFNPGFEPSGVSAETLGAFRSSRFVEGVGNFVRHMRAKGVLVTCQMTMMGNYPHAPSNRISSPHWNTRPHVLNLSEIARLIEEYRFSARQAALADLDGVEIHANHDDLLQWFLSPLTNERTDAYGGSFENRARLLIEVLTAVRAELGTERILGVRLNALEAHPGGYDQDYGLRVARMLEGTGLIDFLHVVIGSPYSGPSYIQSHFHTQGEWSHHAQAFRQAISLPIVHTGLIHSPEVAERILADGHADIVGIARPMMADPQFVSKADRGESATIRPCIECNECISRKHLEGLPFGCAVNPLTGKETTGPWPQTAQRRSVLVVGGGPAGMEFAALARTSGHDVTLWEARDDLGGALADAARVPGYERFGDYLAWQKDRLSRLGVKVQLNTRAEAPHVLDFGADVVAIASGGIDSRPAIAGVHLPHVHTMRDAIAGSDQMGQRVAIVAQDDHMPPLALARLLAERGKTVELIYGTTAPATLVGRYILGSALARLDELGVAYRTMEEVIGIEPASITVRNVYSFREQRLTGYDAIVLACGVESQSSLYDDLVPLHRQVHILGDAYAPRRLVNATRQAHALARLIEEEVS